MLRSLALSVGLSFAALAVSSPAYACKCMFPPVEAAREDATTIFEGRVTSIEIDPTSSDPVNAEKKVTLSIVRTWKGLDHEEQVVVFTNGSSAACGYTFAQDVSYLIYTRDHDGRPLVSSCSRTKPIADAAEDLAVLGAGATPVKVDKAGEVQTGGPTNAGGKAADGAGVPAAAPPSEKKGGCGSSGAQAAMLPLFVALPLLRRRRRGA